MTPKFLLTASLLVAATTAYAQNAPAPSSAPPPPGASAPAPVVRASRSRLAPRAERDNDRDHDRDRDDHGGDMRGPGGGGPGGDGLPPGTWWRNTDIASHIGLTAEQQKHIDDLFLQNRVQLIHLHASLEEAQLMLEPLMNANPVDQPKALAQIDKIADLRADLEKANAKMLLSIRAVLKADQWSKLQAERPGFRDGGPRGPMGHMGHMGQMGPMGPMGRGPAGQQGPPPPQQ